MNCISGFSDSAIKALNAALGAAMGYGHTYIGSEHILYGLVSDDSLPTAGGTAALRHWQERSTAAPGGNYWQRQTYAPQP